MNGDILVDKPRKEPIKNFTSRLKILERRYNGRKNGMSNIQFTLTADLKNWGTIEYNKLQWKEALKNGKQCIRINSENSQNRLSEELRMSVRLKKINKITKVKSLCNWIQFQIKQ